jgi:hypothetical protein
MRTRSCKWDALCAQLEPGERPAVNIYDIPGFMPNGCTCAPDRLPFAPGASFEVACDLHDYDYWRGGTERDRLAADRRLRRLMVRAVRRSGRCARARAWRWARAYYLAVRLFGYVAWTYRDAPLDVRLYLQVVHKLRKSEARPWNEQS